MSEYQLLSLGQICSLIKDGTHGTHPRQKDGIPLISAKDVQDGRITISSDTSRISREEYETIHRTYEIKEDDLLISLVGSIGRCALVTRDHGTFSAQRSVGILKSNRSRVDPKYLYHATCDNQFQQQLLSRSKSTAQAGVYLGELAQCSIPLPPLPEQKKIAEILSGIDRSIYALSQKISRGRLLANAITSELLSKIVSESEMGTIEDIATFITKGTTPTSVGLTFSPKGVAFIKAQSIGGSGETIRSTFSFIDEIAHKQLSRSSLKANDVLITIAGTIGRSAVVPESILPANTNQAVAIVRLDPSRMHSGFLSAWIRSKRCQAHFTGLQTIGAQPNVSLHQISETPVPLISIEGQSHFISAHESFYSSLNSLILEKERYSFMKKSLASDLLSGRKRVSI